MFNYLKEPILYQQSKDAIWLDPHISKQLLAAHLDGNNEGASRNPQFIQQSVDWICQLFPAAKYPKIIDLGCGPGLYAEPLTRLGYQITGIDFSAESIQYARQQALNKQLAITYIKEDYLNQELPDGSYDIALLIYCDLGVFSSKDRQRVFQKVFASLRANGVFIFDVFTAQHYRDHQDSKTWQIEQNSFWSQTKCLRLQQNKHFPEASTFLERHYLIYPDYVKEFFIWDTIFEPQQLIAELHSCGFSEVAYYGDVTGTKYQEISETICLVAKK
ncbi:hypothetical protein RU97_GL001065 [Enterococcus canis]|uniref:Methyltransferase domain-containing protein n=1 Tax=Enterococcus canis TaxID=214095 RepID=A0A1L8RIF7_9ENTE|nr:class I SAM-dependent methyltransferase [Enterococcus canis]OJG19494.1 hypothetical protein RU97_GL001065 [Enterococcus canis]